jgi:hypothetical protein
MKNSLLGENIDQELWRYVDKVSDHLSSMKIMEIFQKIENSRLDEGKKSALLDATTRRECTTFYHDIQQVNNALKHRINIIKNKVETSDLDEKIKSYYLKNIYSFGETYLTDGQKWRHENREYFDQCRYDLNPQDFTILQNYARAGNIVCLLGDINDLSFLNRTISVVDTSNIWDYALIHLKMRADACPRLIWTKLENGVLSEGNQYFSCDYLPFNDLERKEFNELLQGVENNLNLKIDDSRKFLRDLCHINNPSYAICTRETLNGLKNYAKRYFFRVPRLGYIDMNPLNDHSKRLNELSIQEVQDLCQSPETKRFLPRIIENWETLDPHLYLAFSQVEGWQEEFESYFSSHPHCMFPFEEHLMKRQLHQKCVENFRKKKWTELFIQKAIEQECFLFPTCNGVIA